MIGGVRGAVSVVTSPAATASVPLAMLDAATLAEVAASQGVCVRPILRTVTDRATGETTTVAIPCGSTREQVCPTCSAKARRLRITQCREGWHLTDDPARLIPDDDPETDDEPETGDEDDDEPEAEDGDGSGRRARSTRRREDAPALPKVPMGDHTTGRAFVAPNGRTYRPSMFITLTLGSYGKVIGGEHDPARGAPVNPAAYDYRRAALDALHFPRLVDRFFQNLRRCAGYKVQYFAAVEAQRRLAPHLHAAVRGAIPRTVIRQVVAGTYHQLWWPPHTDTDVVYPVGNPGAYPVFDRATGRYIDPNTGVVLPSWPEALADLDADPDARPVHVLWFGAQVDVKGLLGGTPDSDRAVRYLCKYLTKDVAATYTDPDAPNPAYTAHIDRLHAHVRWLPCSPTCANWLRYAIEPKDPGPGLVPGACPSKAHDRENLGIGGRRALVSRLWSGKTLSEHKADRASVVREVLQAAGYAPEAAGRMAADVLHTDGLPRYVWDDIPQGQRPYAIVIAAAVRQAQAWRAQYEHAKTLITHPGAPPGAPVDSRSATSGIAA